MKKVNEDKKKSKKKLLKENKLPQFEKEKSEKQLEQYQLLEKALISSDQLYHRFHYLKISVASPEKIKSWGFRPSPLYYRTRFIGDYYFTEEDTIPKDEEPEKLSTQKEKSIQKKNEEFYEKIHQKMEDFYGSIGEIYFGDSINFSSNKLLLKGLFCPYSFGPIKNWECNCGEFVFNDYKQVMKNVSPEKLLTTLFCPECGGELNDSRVRRYRMGYTTFTIPIVHFWYITGNPKYLHYLSGVKSKYIDSIVYWYDIDEEENPFFEYLSIPIPKVQLFTPDEERRIKVLLDTVEPGDFETPKKAYEHIVDIVLSSTRPEEEREERKLLKPITRRIRRGCELIVAYLENMRPLQEQIKFLREGLIKKSQVNSKKLKMKIEWLLKRLRILESFYASNTDPTWIFFTVLPILPPDLRPLLEMENSRLISSDLNIFYKNIFSGGSYIDIPELGRSSALTTEDAENQLLTRSFVALQTNVDQLIDNARTEKSRKHRLHNLPLKSLTQALEGKEGRFRLNLFGKRANYSARTVIVSGPFLRVDQCGLPYVIAKTLFSPIVYRKILEIKLFKPKYEKKIAETIFAQKFVLILKLLILLAKDYAILLNRAPTLHKFGIQGFEPIIHLYRAVQLHPLVCTGFNADFDGDQMGVYLPLYLISQTEVQMYMKSSQNYFLPTNGDPVVKPTQDMVIGAHYLTSSLIDNNDICFEYFSNKDQVILAFYQKKLSIHTRVFINYYLEKNEFFQIQNNELFFFTDFLPFFKKKIIIEKILYSQGNFCSSKELKKIYLITNLGILIAKVFSNSTYQIMSLFLETTPGRILFEKNLKESIYYSMESLPNFFLKQTKTHDYYENN